MQRLVIVILSVFLLTAYAFAASAQGGLPQCEIVRDAALAALAVCQDELATCEASQGSSLPGDGFTGTPLSFTDLGTTVLDNVTGLQWEKKNLDAASVHYRDNPYTFAQTQAFLDDLNLTCGGEGLTMCIDDTDCVGEPIMVCGFEGLQDWRLPHAKEAVSYADYSVVPVFSTSGIWPDAPSPELQYWTSTPGNPGLRVVGQGRSGTVVILQETLNLRALAVRGPQ